MLPVLTNRSTDQTRARSKPPWQLALFSWATSPGVGGPRTHQASPSKRGGFQMKHATITLFIDFKSRKKKQIALLPLAV